MYRKHAVLILMSSPVLGRLSLLLVLLLLLLLLLRLLLRLLLLVGDDVRHQLERSLCDGHDLLDGLQLLLRRVDGGVLGHDVAVV